MGASINSNNIKSIYYGGSKIKTVYLGDTVVYKSDAVIADDSIDPSYNYYVFDVWPSDYGYVVELDAARRGDTTEWNKLTNWGDGTVDNKLTHKYAKRGPYTVKTKWTISDSSKISLIECKNINKNITHVSEMFRECRWLASIDLTNLNPNITDLSYMFYSCSKLTNVYNINTSNITDMRYMFYNCDKLDGSQFKGWDVSNVTTMFCMFQYSEFTSCLDLSSWNVSNTTSLSYMFNSCYVPYGIDISNWVLSSSVTTYMTFQNVTCNGACKDLEHHVVHNGVSDKHWQRMKQGLY